MVFASDASWKWAFRYAGEGGDPHVYDRFWNNAVRWLIRDPSLDLVQVHGDAERLSIGETIGATVEVRRPDYSPAAGHPLHVKVWLRPSGRPGDVERVVQEWPDAGTNEHGQHRAEYVPQEPGIYEVVATARLDGVPREGRDLVTVEESDPELDEVIPTTPVLEQIADVTGGAFYPLDRPPPETLALKPPGELEVTERRFHDLWTSPWLLAVAIVLFGSEWWLRRRWGYL